MEREREGKEKAEQQKLLLEKYYSNANFARFLQQVSVV